MYNYYVKCRCKDLLMMLFKQFDIERLNKVYIMSSRFREKNGGLTTTTKKIVKLESHNRTLQNEIQKGIEQLKKAETQQLMFDANPHVCLIFDKDYKLIDCNPAALDFYGYKTKDELIANLLTDLDESNPPALNGSFLNALYDRFAYALKTGCSTAQNDLIVKGRLISINSVYKRIDNLSNPAVAVYQTDLRGIREAQQETLKRDRLLSTVNRIASLLLSSNDFHHTIWQCLAMLGECINVDRVYIWENHVVDGRLCTSQIYEWSGGAPPQQGLEITTARPFDEMMPAWEKTLASNICINAHVKDMCKEEQDQLTPQGIVSILIVPIFINNFFRGFIGFDECKNERVFLEYEEQILRSAGLIFASAMERNEIMKNLITAKEEALASTHSKSSFLANMSHEIRTPMNAIIGMTTIARNSDQHEKIQEYLAKIENASRHLLGIINDVLDMSKIEAHKLEISAETFNLESLIANVNSLIRTRMDEKQLNFTINIDSGTPVKLIGDEMRLFQVLTNLLSNAVKFTPKEGEVSLNVILIEKTDTDAAISFSVKDNGIGMSEEQKAMLFQAFTQTDKSISRRFGGTGLGLAISKNIVNLMNGDITVDSEPNVGSCFSFTINFPLSTEDSHIISDVSISADLTGHTVLLVEDIDINREIALAFLDGTGLIVDCAENGEAALKMVSENPDRYNLIYMDIQMPVMDGLEATRRIRALSQENAAKIPIIAMTANAFAEDVAKCKECGMNDHISKPINLSLLIKKTCEYLNKEI